MNRVAVKYLHVDVWTNMALRRALKALECFDEHSGLTPPVESVRGELRDLLVRRQREHIGTGPMARGAWDIAAEKTENELRRRRMVARRHGDVRS